MAADSTEHVDHLLGRVPEIPVAGARRLRRAVALAAVPAVLRLCGRARRPRRSAPAGADRHGAVHVLLGRLGRPDPHRHASDVARGGAARDPWLRRRVLGPAGPGADPRHRRPRAAAERGAPDGDLALHGPAGGTGARRGVPARLRSGLRPPDQRRALPAASCCGCGRRPMGRASASASSRGRAARGFGDIIETARAISSNRVIVSMVLLAGSASLFISNAYQAQMPEFARDLGHGDPGVSYSALLGADAAGALTAGLVLESRGLLSPTRAAPSSSPCCGAARSAPSRCRRRIRSRSCCCSPRAFSSCRSIPWRRAWCSSMRLRPSADASSGSTASPRSVCAPSAASRSASPAGSSASIGRCR